MKKSISLNDIDMNIFYKYFNSTNYSDIKNELVYENLRVDGNRYKNTDLKVYTLDKISGDNDTVVSDTTGLSEDIYLIYKNEFLYSPAATEISNDITTEFLNDLDKNLLKILKIESITTNSYRVLGKTIDNTDINNYMIKSVIYKPIEINDPDYGKKIISNNTSLISYDLEGYNFLKDDDLEILKGYLTDRKDVKQVFKGNSTNRTKKLGIISTSFQNEDAYIIVTSENDKITNIDLLMFPLLLQQPKVDVSGNYIYIDRNNIETTIPQYDNTFYKHQNALRKVFFNIAENNGWFYKVAEKKLTLLEKADKKQFCFWYPVPYNIRYEYSSTTSENGSIDINIPAKGIFDDPSKGNSSRSLREPAYFNFIEDTTVYPRLKAYIGKNKSEYNISTLNSDGGFNGFIEGVDEDNFKLYQGKPCVLKIYSRTIDLLNQTYNISENNTITINCGLNNEKSTKDREFNVYNIHGEPYILYPIVLSNIDNSNNVLSLQGKSITLGSQKLSIKAFSNATLGSVYLSMNSEKIPLKTAESFGINEKEVLRKLLEKYLISNKLYFFKIPLSNLVETQVLDDVFCILKNHKGKPEEVSTFVVPKVPIKNGNPKNSTSESKTNSVNLTPIAKEVPPIEGEISQPITLDFCAISKQAYQGYELDNFSLSFSTENVSYEEKITYYENPYSTEPSKKYLKKTESVGSANPSIITCNFTPGKKALLLSIDSLSEDNPSEDNPYTGYYFYNYFINSDAYFTEGILQLRGSLVESGVALNMRKDALRNSFTELLTSSDSELLDPAVEFFSADGNARMYNYCKSLESIVEHNYSGSNIETTLTNTFYNIYDYEIRLPLVKKDLTTSENVSSAKSGRFLVEDRPLIQKLVEADKFPIDSYYDDYIRATKNTLAVPDDITKFSNNHLNKSSLTSAVKPGSTVNEIGNFSRALYNFLKTGNRQFLNFKVNIDYINVEGEKITDEEKPYRKLYTYSLKEASIDNMITDLIKIEIEGDKNKIWRVDDGN